MKYGLGRMLTKVMSDFLSVNCQTLVRLISDKRSTDIEQVFDE